MARGYRGHPALTAASFVPDPLSGRPGERLYRSGDLARRRRGRRISVPRPARRAGQGARLPHRDRRGRVGAAGPPAGARGGGGAGGRVLGGERRLAAWVAPESAVAADLRGSWAQRLPAYMIPSAFTPVAALPLTPNGKVDRRALPAPVLAVAAAAMAAGEARRSPPSRSCWPASGGDLLGVERVGAGDDFFALGGHSLVATRLASRAAHAVRRRAAAGGDLRGADPGGAGRPRRRRRSAERARATAPPIVRRCRATRPATRSPSPRSASGSSTASIRRARPTTSPAPSGCAARSPGGARRRARRDRPPARGAAHRLPRLRRCAGRAGAGGAPRDPPAAAALPLIDLAALPEAAAPRRGRPHPRRRGAAAVRPRARSAGAHPAASAWGTRSTCSP